MNNAIMQMIGTIMRGGNPQQLFAQMVQQFPPVRQAMQMLEGKSQQQQMDMLRNMARERGTDLETVARQMGLPLK